MLYVKIINDGTGDVKVGSYSYTVGVNQKVISTGVIKDYQRIDGWLNLLKKVVEEEDKKRDARLFAPHERWSDMVDD